MATVNFLYRSTRPETTLTLRLRFRKENKSLHVEAATKFVVGKDFWANRLKKTNNQLLKNERIVVLGKLLKIENFIVDALKSIKISEINKEWLKTQIEYYYNPPDELNETVSFWIQKIIDDAPYRNNSKGGVGLSKSRVDSYKQLLLHFNNFQGKNIYAISQMNKQMFDEFKKYLLGEKNFSSTYSLKKLADLKTVCKEARSNGVVASTELSDLKIRQVSPYDDDMDVISLTIDDIEKIEEAELESVALINARKWLILGVFTGQRGNSLISRVVEENFHKYGSDLEIRIKQKKGNKSVRIPVLPRVKKIYENGLPYPISTQKLRKHFKSIGELAKINNMIMGRVTEAVGEGENKVRRGVKKLRPKFEYIGMHTLRRSFACLHYGKLPTPLIMKITGHKKEATFIQYLNQDGDEHLDAFLDYYKKKEEKSKGETNLTIVKKKQRKQE